MFEVLNEIGFSIVKPFILNYMKKKNYPFEAVTRKNGYISELGFDKKIMLLCFMLSQSEKQLL